MNDSVFKTELISSAVWNGNVVLNKRFPYAVTEKMSL